MLIPAHAVRRGNLFKLPPEIPLDIAPLLEPMACCINGLREMHEHLGDDSLCPRRAGPSSGRGTAGPRRLAILGAGPIGLLHAKLARAYGGYERIVMTEPLAHRRELALRHGADEVLSPDEFDAREEFDDVIIAFGDTSLVETAMRAARKCGHVSMFAGFDKDVRPEFDPNLVHYNQLRITGGSESRRRDYVEALSLVREGRVDLTGMITHRFSLGDYEQAFAAATQRLGLKVAFEELIIGDRS
jgi:L-iditol 2-dehydrogenase